VTSFLANASQVVLFLLGVFLIIVILLQRGRGGGLAGAFGGMGGQSAFGTKAGDVFTRITIVLAVCWVILAGGSGYLLRAASKGSKYTQGPGAIEGSTGAGSESSAAGGTSAPESGPPATGTPDRGRTVPGGMDSTGNPTAPADDSQASPTTSRAPVTPQAGASDPARPALEPSTPSPQDE
jgi:preprotein translocase subunit SecG